MDRADGRSRFWSSGICACAAWQRSRPQRAKQRRKHGPYRSQKSQLFGNRCLAREPIRVHAGQRLEETNRDRKSTRLNSSHGYISYAVFCLKKKNYTPHVITSSARSSTLHFSSLFLPRCSTSGQYDTSLFSQLTNSLAPRGARLRPQISPCR